MLLWALLLTILLLCIFLRKIYRQQVYIKELESIQVIGASGMKSLFNEEQYPEIIELCAEKYIDENRWYDNAVLEAGEMNIFKKQLSEELMEQLMKAGLLKVELYTQKDELGNPLPIWESLLRARLRICKITG